MRRETCAAEAGRAAGKYRVPGGSKAEVDMMPVMLKRLTLTGSTLRPRTWPLKAPSRQR